MSSVKPLYIKEPKEWHRWLEKNHCPEKEVWLIYYKKHRGKKGILYEESVEEALPFGWIDSVLRGIDDEKYCRKFTSVKQEDNS